jgi:hypothetical protein
MVPTDNKAKKSLHSLFLFFYFLLSLSCMLVGVTVVAVCGGDYSTGGLVGGRE